MKSFDFEEYIRLIIETNREICGAELSETEVFRLMALQSFGLNHAQKQLLENQFLFTPDFVFQIACDESGQLRSDAEILVLTIQHYKEQLMIMASKMAKRELVGLMN